MSRSVVFLIVILTIILGYTAYYKSRNTIQHIEKKEVFFVQKVTVIKGHEFDILLQDGAHIRASLSVTTVPEAKKEVVRLLHLSSKSPSKLVVYHHTKSWATVDLLLTIEGQEISLVDWLKNKKLIYDHQCQSPPILWGN